MSVDALLAEIRSRWAQVRAPRANLEAWDQALAEYLRGYTVFNWTDFNYGKCHTYEILLPRGEFSLPGSAAEGRTLLQSLGGQRHSILLRLSAVAPYYLIRLLRSNIAGEQIVQQEVQPSTGEQQELLQRVEQFAQERGFRALPGDYLQQLVPGAALELAVPGTVTVYNCLFEDEANRPPLSLATS